MLIEKLDKRLRNRQIVELLATSELEKKADFGDRAKLGGPRKETQSLKLQNPHRV